MGLGASSPARLVRGKRTADDAGLDDESDGANGEERFEEHVRRRMRTTSDYIYRTLFVNGEGSDVTVCALGGCVHGAMVVPASAHVNLCAGHEWRLHRVYLKQAKYFESLFSGRWKALEDNTVHVEVLDANVDRTALETAFESLYRDDIVIGLPGIVGVLAAATLLQIEGLMDVCAAQMVASVRADTVATFHAAGVAYGREDVASACVAWLERHLCTAMPSDALRLVDTGLMAEIVRSPRLLVVHVELDVYMVLRRWLYLRVKPSAPVTRGRHVVADSAEFFRGRGKGAVAFLDTDEGRPFVPAFRALRMAHMLNDHRNIDVIARDNVIPSDWLDVAYRSLWSLMLRGGWDPANARADFAREGLRCGRILVSDTQLMWRWMGFSHGFDVLVTYHSTNRILTLRRNTKALQGASPTTVCLNPRRRLLYRLSVGAIHESELADADQAPLLPPTPTRASGTPATPPRVPSIGLPGAPPLPTSPAVPNGVGHSVETSVVEKKAYFRSTDLCERDFALNEEVVALAIDSDAPFPLFVSLTMLFPRNGP